MCLGNGLLGNCMSNWRWRHADGLQYDYSAAWMWEMNLRYKRQIHQTTYCAAKTQDRYWQLRSTSQFLLQPPWRMSTDSWEKLHWTNSYPHHLYGAIILLRRFGVSLFTYIFSISFSGRLDPSGKLMNFQPPPAPRFPCGPSFSTM